MTDGKRQAARGLASPDVGPRAEAPLPHAAPPPLPPAAPLEHVLDGLRHSLSVPGLVLFASFVGFGALLQGIDFPLLAGLLATALIWALPAQVILVGGLASGTALPAIALAVALSSLRLLPMVVSIAPYLRGRRRSLVLELWCAHYVAMSMWVEGLRLLPHRPAEARVPFALGLGNGFIGISLLGTVAGYFLAGELPPPLAAGLLFLTPLSFSLLMVRNSADMTDWLALVAGFAILPLVMHLDGGLDLMLAGIGGGSLAYGIGRVLRKRRRS